MSNPFVYKWTVLFQTIQFSKSAPFSMTKTFLFQAIQFSQTVLIKTIQFSISIVFVHTQLHVKTVLFQADQFSTSTHFSSFWSIDRTLLGATTPGQSAPRSDGNEGVLHIPQRSSITGTLPSDCLVSYPGHLLGVPYPSAEMQSVYSTALPTSWLGKICLEGDILYVTKSKSMKFIGIEKFLIFPKWSLLNYKYILVCYIVKNIVNTFVRYQVSYLISPVYYWFCLSSFCIYPSNYFDNAKLILQWNQFFFNGLRKMFIHRIPSDNL